MREILIILSLIVSSFCAYADDNDAIYDPIQTPIYLGKTLFCSKIADDINKTPCDIESRLVVYSQNVEDTIRGVLQFRINFDTTKAMVNTELAVKDITDLRFVRCDKSGIEMDTFQSEFYEELCSWHWWLGEYINPLTLYPQQVWTIKYIVIKNQ